MADVSAGPAQHASAAFEAFRARRQPPDPVAAAALARMIEGDIIPRLLLAHRRDWPQARTPAPAGINAEQVDAFARLALGHDFDVIFQHVWGLLEQGVAPTDVFVGLLGPAARRLGDHWNDDLCSFTDVTMALCRLQQTVHELAARLPVHEDWSPVQRTALFAATPGEQHTFGVTIVADMFRRAGWFTQAEPGASRQALLQLARVNRFDLIGLSVGCTEHLASLEELVMSVRRCSQNRAVGVLLGGCALAERPHGSQTYGADLIICDAHDAVGLAEELVRGLSGARA